ERGPCRLDRVMRQRGDIESCVAPSLRPRSVVASLRQESDHVHPAIGVLERKRQVGALEEVEKQRLPRGVLAAASPDVRVEAAALQKQRKRRLIDERQMIVAEMLQFDEAVEQRIGNNGVARSEERRGGK